MTQSNKYLYLLIGLGLIFFFPFLGAVHLFDWDEINFAESAREMLVTNDYFRVRINYDPFWEKPPFFMWLQVLSMKLFGINEFAARFPNAFFGVLTLITIFFIGKKLHKAKFGLIWGIIYLGSFLPHMYYKSGIIDPIFNFFIFLSIYFLASNIQEVNKSKKTYLSIISGALIGMAIITKGPVGLLLLILTFTFYLIFKKFKVKIRGIDILLFSLSALTITFSWFGYEVFQNGPWFIVEFIQYQIELFSEPVAGHEQPFFYHFVVVLLGCFPMSILAIGGFKKINKNEKPIDFLLWAKILFWVVLILFSIVKTKIVHYSSMTYLPLSYIAAFYIYKITSEKKQLNKVIQYLILFFGAIFSFLLVLTPILFYQKETLKSFMNDPFAEASLNIDMGWTGGEFICGLIYLFGLGIGSYWLYKSKYLKGIYIFSIAAGITLLSYSIFIVPKIEKFSQGPAIEFFEKKSKEDCYITTIGHKSYAHYFYSKVKPLTENDKMLEVKNNYLAGLGEKKLNVIELNTLINNWLLTGEIDKKSYFVTKVTKRDEMKQYEEVKFLYNKGGFDFYSRMP